MTAPRVALMVLTTVRLANGAQFQYSFAPNPNTLVWALRMAPRWTRRQLQLDKVKGRSAWTDFSVSIYPPFREKVSSGNS